MNIDKFVQELKKININITDKQLDDLNVYANFLIEFNSHTNLTAITEMDEIYLKHFYDSLVLAKYINLNEVNNLIDIGTGAGFPGMVLKIVFPNLDVTLLDSNNKKLKFLDELINKLDLKGVRTVYERAEEFARKGNIEKYDLVTSRAVAALPVLSELCLPLTKVNGVFFALKGSNGEEELKLSNNIISKLNGKVEYIDKFNLADTDEGRTAISIRKIGKNPSGYPRDYGKIKKDYQRMINGNK